MSEQKVSPRQKSTCAPGPDKEPENHDEKTINRGLISISSNTNLVPKMTKAIKIPKNMIWIGQRSLSFMPQFPCNPSALHGSFITPELGDDREPWNTVRGQVEKLDRHDAVIF